MSSFSKTEGISVISPRPMFALQNTGRQVGFFTERSNGNVAGFMAKCRRPSSVS